MARLRQDLYAALVRQEIGFFDASRTGDLTNRLAADTTVLQDAVTRDISMGLRFALTLTGSLVIMAVSSWRLTLVMLSIVPVVAVGATFYAKMLRRVSRQVQDALGEAAAVADETLGGIRTVRAFAREQVEIARYGAAVERSFELARRRARLRGVFMGATTFLGYGSIAAVVWYGGHLVGDGLMTLGDLTAFILYTFTVAFSVGFLTSLWGDYAKALGASERVVEVLERPPEVSGGTDRLDAARGEVRFEEVAFAYPVRPEAQVLEGFSLTLRPGEVVALVGPSGAGKSTVASLLTRFYDPLAGAVSLDGTPTRPSTPTGCVSRSGSSLKSRSCSRPRSTRTFATAAPTRPAQRSRPRRSPPTPTRS